jgi:MFS family permease
MTSGYILPIFTLNLSTSFKLTESHIALIFTAGQLVCAITAVLASKISTVPRRRWLSAFGCLIVTVSIFLMGPSRLLDLPNNYTLILIAMLLNGTGFTLVFIHVTPEVIRSVCEKKGI